MKKCFALVLAVMLLLSVVPIASAKQQTFTLMIYLCGTDLESDGGMAVNDLAEMIESGVRENSGLTVYIQTGGTKKWSNDALDNKKAQRWLLTGEGIEEVESLGKVNMGAQDSFTDFLVYGVQHYPADRYGLILWDHGGGSADGVCFDELTSDALFMDEIYASLDAVSKQSQYSKFAFIGFDACLMATYEMANTLEPFADYMIASEELEPGTGWQYTAWLKALGDNPSINIEELGSIMVQDFLQSVDDAGYGEYGTLSVLDLSKLSPLRTAVESMGENLSGEISAGNYSKISRIRQGTRTLGETDDAGSDLIDMRVFADIYQGYNSSAAKAIRSAMKDLVVVSGSSSNLSNISGLSILVPFTTVGDASTYLGAYDTRNVFPEYASFVRQMVSSCGGSYTFGSTSVQTESTQNAMVDWYSQYATDSDSYYQAYDSWDEDDSSFSLGSFLNFMFGCDDVDYNSSACGGSLWGDLSTDDESDSSWFTDSSVNSANFGDLWSGVSSADSSISVETSEGAVALDNPFAGSSAETAYAITLNDEDMQNLGNVEANLMMDVSDPDFECYVDLGYDQNVLIDWDNGKVYGLFDGTWPTLDGQMVCMYDQISNERFVRSLIPVTVNGAASYLVVVFDEANPSGVVVGYSEGYNESGLPVRGYSELAEGDVIIPQYELIYWDDSDQQQSEPFEGDPITVGADLCIPFGYEDVESDADYVYGFCLNDIYGGYQFTDFATLSF